MLSSFSFSLVVVLAVLLLPGSPAEFVLLKNNCEDGGQFYEPGQVWYHPGECARYGCFKPDKPSTYRMTCPDYPIPDCHYNLVSSPSSPFPNCCVHPVCTTSG